MALSFLPSDAYYQNPVGMPYIPDYSVRWQKRDAQGVCACGGKNGVYVKNTTCLNYRAYGYNCSKVRVESDGTVFSMEADNDHQYPIGPDFGSNYAETHLEEFSILN